MVYILPHWTHPNLQTGTIIPVVSYSNCDEVELLINGQSLGRKNKVTYMSSFGMYLISQEHYQQRGIK